MSDRKRDAKQLAGDLAKDCIVTKALGRFLFQVMEAIHDDEIAPRDAEIERLRSGLKTLLDWNIGIQNGHGNHHVQDHIDLAVRALAPSTARNADRER